MLAFIKITHGGVRMEFALRHEADGSTVLIDSCGNPVGQADKDEKTLHLLPKLLLDDHAARDFELSCVSVELISDHCELLTPAGGIKVRQPYPNARYLVGGSEGQRNGWCVSAEKLPPEFDVEFLWVLLHRPDADHGCAPIWSVRHRLKITLQDGVYRTYTMSVNCWPRVSGQAAPIYRQAVAFVRKRQATSAHFGARNTLQIREDDSRSMTVSEHVVIPPVPYEQALVAINAFQEQQLHERKQVSTYTSCNSEHAANSSVELPAMLLLEAIHLARTVTYDAKPVANGEDHTGRLEKHPALQLLSNWWEENRPDRPGAMRAGYVMPLIRAQDDDVYWTGYLEIPNVKIESMAAFAQSSAACGDSVLIQFFASASYCSYPDGFFETHLTDGTFWCECSAVKAEVVDGKFDEAWYSLEALAGFPSNFPAAYCTLKAAAKGSPPSRLPPAGTTQPD